MTAAVQGAVLCHLALYAMVTLLRLCQQAGATALDHAVAKLPSYQVALWCCCYSTVALMLDLLMDQHKCPLVD
jgi:hypothetical protein